MNCCGERGEAGGGNIERRRREREKGKPTSNIKNKCM